MAKRRRLAWVDDDSEAYQAWSKDWPADSPYQLQFYDLNELAKGEDALFALVESPPDVVVIDWADGNYAEIYAVLKGKVPCAFLKSVLGQEHISASGVYEAHPELLNRTLQFPFPPETLLGSIAAAVEQQAVAVAPTATEALKTLPLDLERNLGTWMAVRTFDKHWQPANKSPAWKEAKNRPGFVFSDKAKLAIEEGRHWVDLLFCADPAEPSNFGLMQSTCVKLPGDGSDQYLQWLAPVSEQMMDPTNGGLSRYGETVDGIIALAAQAGFIRGRYYRVSAVDGLKRPLLELVACVPVTPGATPLPVAIEMDDQEYSEFSGYVDSYRRGDRKAFTFISEPVGLSTDSPNDLSLWKQYVPQVGITERRVVPAFRKGCWEGSDDRIEDALNGVFVFDMGRPGVIDPRQWRAIAAPLLAALKFFRKAQDATRTANKRERAENLWRSQQEWAECKGLDALESAVTSSVLDILYPPGGAQPADRSAVFARYDPLRRTLRVTADTDMLMNGFVFGLDLQHFFLVRAATEALDAMKEGKQPQAIFVPSIHQVRSQDAIQESDWLNIFGCDQERAAKCHKWLWEKVRTVIAYPLVVNDELLGVLVVRSKREYEFTRSRVGALRDAATAAMPLLARAIADLHHQVFAGLVMHEMRSHLQRTRSKLDMAAHAKSSKARRGYLQQADRTLTTGHSLSSLFLSFVRNARSERGPASSEDFWQRLDAYGRLCADDPATKLGWRLRRDAQVEFKASQLLERVLLVLVDNAFRHGSSEDASGGQVKVTVRQDEEDSGWAEVEVRNPGRFEGSMDFSRHDDPADPHIGLTLASRACAELGGALSLVPDAAQDPIRNEVTATLRWPTAQTNREEAQA